MSRDRECRTEAGYRHPLFGCVRRNGSPSSRRRNLGLFGGQSKNLPESGWIATISKPRFQGQHQAHSMRRWIGAGHDGPTVRILRHRDRALRHRLGSARHQCGAAADGSRGKDPGPHPPALWRYRGGRAAGRGAARDRRHRRIAGRKAGRSVRHRARSRRRAGVSTAASTTSPARSRRARP